MKEAIALSATGQLQPSFMVTHIGGLDAVPETVLNLPDIHGGKKLIYNGVTMPLTAIADFAEKAKPIRCLKSWRGWLRKRTASGMNRPRNICWHNLALISGGRAMMSWRGHYFALRNRQRWLPAANRMWRQNKIDGTAVTAMRQALNDVAFRGRVVIGEGEIDHAPMLWIGEEVGKGDGPEVDIAVDPIEGTRMVAMGQSNALAVMAFAPRDSLLHAPDMYMKKLVVNRLAAGAIDLSLPLTDNLRNVAKALGKPLDKLRMVTLDKPRLSAAIEEATQLGVKVLPCRMAMSPPAC